MTEQDTAPDDTPQASDGDELDAEELEQVAGAEGGSDHPGPIPPIPNPGDNLPW